jgi:CHAT domain-containing protein/lipopolysaccharide biosynthesis regulator YciM
VQAQQLYASGSYQEAVTLASRALQTRERELGPNNPSNANTLHQLAFLKAAVGANDESRNLNLRAIAAREQALGPGHPDVADSLVQLGQIYTTIGEYEKSGQTLRRALNIYEHSLGAKDPRTAMALNALGNLYFMTEAMDKAAAMYRRTLSIRESALGPESAEASDALANLANVYALTGEYSKGINAYQRAVAIREKTSGPNHPKTAQQIANLGNLYRMIGDYAQAEQLNRRALAIREKSLGPDNTLVALNLQNLALIYQCTGAYSMAESAQRRALAIYTDRYGLEHIDSARSLGSLASLSYLIGDYKKAEPLFLQALAIYERLLGPDNLSVGLMLENLADTYTASGDYAKAKPAYERALDMRKRLLGSDNPETARLLYLLGSLYAHTGEIQKSESLQLQALSIRENTLALGHPDVIESINAVGSIYWRNGSTAKALQEFSKAQLMQAKNTERFLVTNSEFRRRSFLQAQNNDVFKLVSFAVSQPSREAVTLGLTSVLQYKGRVLDEATDSNARLRASMNENDKAIFQQLNDVTTQLSNLTYQTGTLTAQEHRQKLQLLLQRQEVLEGSLAERSSEYRKHITPITVSSVSRSIPKDAVLVEWFRYIKIDPNLSGFEASNEPRYVAFVVKHDQDPVSVDIGDAHTIETLTHEFRLALSDSKRADVKERAAALSAVLLKPLSGYLKGFEHILVSPDGALNLVPMAALVNEQGVYLAQQFNITYVTSGRDLLRIDLKPKSRGNALIIADPEYGNSSLALARNVSAPESQRSADLDRGGLIFRPLINTALEAQEIKEVLKVNSSIVLLHGQATEAYIKQVHSPQILHIATHGFFLSDQESAPERTKLTASIPVGVASGENPLLRAGIALAGANTRHSGANDDGILTALEVSQLDLRDTGLVVLSACDSGVGDVENGEGVYGLRRALVLAGAQTQVTSVWKVPDEATRTLMVRFYQGLLSGEGRSASLQHAQQFMLTNPATAHPYYWASFILAGNWSPLPALQQTSP